MKKLTLNRNYFAQTNKYSLKFSTNLLSFQSNRKLVLLNRFFSVSSVDVKEISKFSQLSQKWWDLNGPLKTLHEINPLRVQYIKSQLIQNIETRVNNPFPLQGLSILDIGCGGGLLSECLTRLGAQVTGIDASEQAIQAAKLHAIKDPSLKHLEYLHSTAEQLQQAEKKFDVVCALEIIEHVANPQQFVSSCSSLLNVDSLSKIKPFLTF